MDKQIELEQVAQINGCFDSSGRVYSINGLSPTINTCGGGQRETKILEEKNLKTQMCNKLIVEGKIKENDVIRHSYSTKRMNGEMKDIQENNMCPTLDTRFDCLGVCVNDSIAKGNVANNMQTEIEPQLIGGIGEINFGSQYRQGNRIYDGEKIACALNASPVGNAGGSSYLYAMQEPTALDEQNNYIRKDGCVGTLTTDGSSPKHNNRVVEPKAIAEKQNYRIRKLTPKECGRLMCVKDKDIDKIAKHQSQHSQYHLYGDSICCFPLMAIFGEMFEVDWQEKVEHFYDNVLQ